MLLDGLPLQEINNFQIQSWEFIIVKKEDKRKKLVELSLDQEFIKQAPVVVVACANEKRSKRRYGERGELYSKLDTAAAIQNMLLAAYSLELGSIWVGAFNEELVKGFLDIPEYVKVIAIIPIGYPAEKTPAPPRFDINKISYPEKYGAEWKERKELKSEETKW